MCCLGQPVLVAVEAPGDGVLCFVHCARACVPSCLIVMGARDGMQGSDKICLCFWNIGSRLFLACMWVLHVEWALSIVPYSVAWEGRADTVS